MNENYESPYQKLFNHLQDEHGLILLESELQEIIRLSLEAENFSAHKEQQ